MTKWYGLRKNMSINGRQIEVSGPISSRRLAFGAGVMGIGNLLKVGLQIAVLPLMARLLGPAEFGLYALAMPTVTLLQMLADGGFGNSLAREPETSIATWSTAFWILHGFCALLAMLVVGWSFVLAGWTHQPRLPPIMGALSLSLLLLANSILPGARLTRRGQIGKSAGADTLANFVGAAGGIALALHKAGAWSLVAQYLITYATRTFLLNLAAFELPTFRFDLKVMKGHFAVGGALVGSKLADFIGRMIENALLSRALGTPALGAYSFGNQVSRFLTEAVSNPAWATLYVQALRNEREAALRTYYRLTRLLGLLVLPMATLAAVAASSMIPLVLGPSWSRATPVIIAVLPTYAFSVVGAQSSALLYAYGRSDIWFWIASANAAARVSAVALSPFVGLSGVGVLIGLVCLAQGFASIFAPARAIGANPWKVVRSLSAAFVASATSGASYLISINIQSTSVAAVLMSTAVSIIVGILSIALVERGAIVQDFELFKKILTKST